MSTVPMKKVTLLVPAHIADLIEETQDTLDWESWACSPVDQAIDNDSLAGCLGEFESLFIKESFAFENDADRNRFMGPINRAVTKAWKREQALRRKPVVA